MNKYGVENFIVEELEYIPNNENLSDREIYWIKELGTYGKNGYNATRGGDGSILYDHNEIIELYNLGYNVSQISSKIRCDETLIRRVLKANGIKSRGRGHKVLQYDIVGNLINTFDSSTEAAEWIVSRRGGNLKTVRGGINQVCRGERY